MRKFKRQWVYDLVCQVDYGEDNVYCTEAEFRPLEEAWEHECGNGMEHAGIVGFRMRDDGRYYGIKLVKNYHEHAAQLAEGLPRKEFLTLREVKKAQRIVTHEEWAFVEEKEER